MVVPGSQIIPSFLSYQLFLTSLNETMQFFPYLTIKLLLLFLEMCGLNGNTFLKCKWPIC